MKITNKKLDNIEPEMFGLFFEDINFAADGGLYAEMVENRSFEAKEAFGTAGKFYTIDDPGYAWSEVCSKDGSKPLLQYVQGTPLSEVNPHYLRVTTTAPGQGFKNKAYDGITLKANDTYKVSFYARCVQYEANGLMVDITKNDTTYASSRIELKKAVQYAPYCDVEPGFVSGWKAVDDIAAYRRTLDLKAFARESEWVRYETVLTSSEDVRGADFVIRLDDAGVVEFDLISMIPENAVAGIYRKDLFEALDSIHPGFIRFPGGCIVEGISLENRYNWKQTVGEMKDRKYKPNLWAFVDDRDEKNINVQRPDSHYGQSYGIGFYEYFLLCELLGAKPLPVVGIGVACQFRSDEMVDITDEAFQNYIDDALDLIEFANGDCTTRWGSLRCKMGHEKAFNLELLGIGNEQWETSNVHLFERLDAFEKAIHDKYPEIKIVGTAGPGIDLPMAKTAWDYYREKQKTNANYAYAVDEHYYVAPKWLYERIDLYDSYPREVGVFAGEYAAHPANRGNNMEGALAEAAFLTGVEKNAGVVKLASYAPLFNRIGHSQWKPDMIWFDDKGVYLTPSYYVQKMYANNVGDYTLDMEGEELSLRAKQIYVSATAKEDGTKILKVANCSEEMVTLPLTDENGKPIVGKAYLQSLTEAHVDNDETAQSALIKDNGEMPQPVCFAEQEIMVDGQVALEAKSFSVIRW